MRVLTEDNKYDKKVPYILNDNNTFNQMRLYDYSKKMADIFMNYDNECFEISDSFQRDLYKDSTEHKCIKDKYITKKELVKLPMSEIKSPVFVFVTRELTPFENYVISKCGNAVKVYTCDSNIDKKPNVKLSSAPSTLREIEVLHSEICKLIDNNVKLNDIVVYSPVIDKYESDIIRVFKQYDEKYPDVPYVLTVSRNNHVLEILNVLLTIMRNGYCTRTDMSKIISNTEIKKVNGFSNADVDVILAGIIDTNTYRDKDERENDWKHLKERLILSKLVGDSASLDNIAVLSDGTKNIPYNFIALDDNLKVKLIKIIDVIIALKDISLKDSLKDKLDALEDVIVMLFGEEGSYAATKVLKVFNLFRELNLNESNNITIETLMYSLLEMGNYSIMDGVPFSTGITFLSMNERNVINAKYAFIIGFSSNNYPRADIKDSLNLNQRSLTKEDINIYNRLITNTENLYVSYVNEDLKTGEEFFLCPLLNNLITKKDEDHDRMIRNMKEEKCSLDENRELSELYTKREIENKKYYLGLLGNDVYGIQNNDTHEYKPQELHDTLNARALSDYLSEPLKAKANLLFGTYDDEQIDNINKAFEPIVINRLSKSVMVTDLLTALGKNENTDDIIKLYELENELPRFEFDEAEIGNLTEVVKEVNKHYVVDDKYEIKKMDNIILDFDEKAVLEEEVKCIDDAVAANEAKIDEQKVNDAQRIRDLDDIMQKIQQAERLDASISDIDEQIKDLTASIKNESNKDAKNQLKEQKANLESSKKDLKIELKNLNKTQLKNDKEKLSKVKPVEQAIEKINTVNSGLADLKSYLTQKLASLSDFNKKQWTLVANKVMYVKEDNDNLSYSLLKIKETSKLPGELELRDMPELYINSLVDIANRNTDINYNASLSACYLCEGALSYLTNNITINSKEAKSLLNRIYSHINNYEENVYVAKDDGDITSSYALYVKSCKEQLWGFYNDKNMFDVDSIAKTEDTSVDMKNDFIKYYNKVVLRHGLLFR